HAGVMALSRLGEPSFAAASRDESSSVRLAVLLAYRRLGSPRAGDFLADTDPGVVAEAARAIHDEPLAEALPRLASLIGRPQLSAPVPYRVPNALFRLGRPDNAARLARSAGRSGAPVTLRVEALKMLGDWEKPGRRARAPGLTQDLGPRPATAAAALRAS